MNRAKWLHKTGLGTTTSKETKELQFAFSEKQAYLYFVIQKEGCFSVHA